MGRRRNRRNRAHAAGSLSSDEQWALVYGDLTDRWPFTSDDEARAAWDRHGEKLLAQSPPGRRPWAWWWREHNVRSLDDIDQLQKLFELGAIGSDEADQIEKREPQLAGFSASVDHVDDGEVVWRIRQFEFAAKWHKWRGRLEIASLYQNAIAKAEQILKERAA